MAVVGLTGGIGTGKSTVSSLLKAHSVTVIDADVIARQVVEPGTKAHREIVKYFGRDILLADGRLDRPKLGAVIFGDAGKRNKLNSIVHPAVRMEMVRQAIWAWLKGNRYCVMDVPLLIETGLHHWVALTVVVSWYVMCPDIRSALSLTRFKALRKFSFRVSCIAITCPKMPHKHGSTRRCLFPPKSITQTSLSTTPAHWTSCKPRWMTS